MNDKLPVNRIIQGNCTDILKTLPADSVEMCVCSPPYFGLRQNPCEPIIWGGDKNCRHEWGQQLPCHHPGQVEQTKWKTAEASGKGQTAKSGQFCQKCGAWLGQLGLEPSPEAYCQHLVEIFREVRRVLKSQGTLWLNLGDSYASNGIYIHSWYGKDKNKDKKHLHTKHREKYQDRKAFRGGEYNIKAKDLIGIPFSVAFALRADGWYLRQDIIWCLSGGTYIYAKTQKGIAPVMIRDLARLSPDTIQLWTGEKWSVVQGISKSKRKGTEIMLVLRNGERISCTPNHKFPVRRGTLTHYEQEAKNILKGDVILSVSLPETDNPRDCFIDTDAAWLAGLYIAEGSRSEDTIQIAGHTKEADRWNRLRKIANKFGGYITRDISGNNMSIRMYGKVLNALINELVGGKTAKDKHFASVVWNYSNRFIQSMLMGYLAGDGHWDRKNKRWRLGFTRNYYLERDLRTACARLGYRIILKPSFAKYNNEYRPSFRGEIRTKVSRHFNNKSPFEVVNIQKARCRDLYDIGIESVPHHFALASGVLSHNSKPNPMPESVTDRCTRSHEYIFLLSKSKSYYFDNEAIKEPCVDSESLTGRKFRRRKAILTSGQIKTPGCIDCRPEVGKVYLKRNKRDVWTVTVKSGVKGHFSSYPLDLIEPCILAGAPRGGIVIDPFIGSGSTAIASLMHNRRYLGIELSPKFIEIAEKRIMQFRIQKTKELSQGQKR